MKGGREPSRTGNLRQHWRLYELMDVHGTRHTYEWDGYRIYYRTYVKDTNRNIEVVATTTVLGLQESMLLSNVFIELGRFPYTHESEKLEIMQSEELN